MSQHRLWKIFGTISENRNIPSEVTASVYRIMTRFTRGQLTEEETIQVMKSHLNRMAAGARHYHNLLSALEEEE